MKKLYGMLALFVFAALFAYSAYAAEVRATMGNYDDTNKYTLEEKDDNVVYIRPAGGIRYPYEKKTTNDTITAQESGRKFSIAPTSATTMTLPGAEVGMEFTFNVINSSATQKVILNPNDADTFRGVVNSAAPTTFAAGDSVISSGASGDTIKIMCNEATFWDVESIRGTWADNN